MLRVSTVMKLVFAAIILSTGAAKQAVAGCFPSVQLQPKIWLASTQPTVEITYLGHSSFLLKTAQGTTAVTDYNGVHRPPSPPDIVTMNNAHSTHFTTLIEPEIKHALEGWGQNNQIATHDVTYEDIRVRNVPTSVHGREGAQANSNSIFVFEIDDLCVAHLGHLHHTLTDLHLGELGVIDILMVPIDGTWTMSQKEMAAVVRQIRPAIVLPMHFWGEDTVRRFAAHLPQGWTINNLQISTIALSRLTMGYREVALLRPASGF